MAGTELDAGREVADSARARRILVIARIASSCAAAREVPFRFIVQVACVRRLFGGGAVVDVALCTKGEAGLGVIPQGPRDDKDANSGVIPQGGATLGVI